MMAMYTNRCLLPEKGTSAVMHWVFSGQPRSLISWLCREIRTVVETGRLVRGFSKRRHQLPGAAVTIKHGVQALFFHWRIAEVIVAWQPENLSFFWSPLTGKCPEVETGHHAIVL